MDPFRHHSEDSDDYLRDNLIKGMKANASLGWTQTQDAGMAYRLVDLMKAIHDRWAHGPPGLPPLSLFPKQRNSSAEAWKARTTTCSPSMASRSLSTARWAPGAALIENYADADHNGFMNRTTKEDLMPVLAEEKLRQGVQIETHVIGDRAVKSLLDWYGEAQAALPRGSLGDRGSSVAPGTRTDHSARGSAALSGHEGAPSMQPSHGIGDLNFAPARLRARGLKYAYPWKDLVDQGLMILGARTRPWSWGIRASNFMPPWPGSVLMVRTAQAGTRSSPCPGKRP